MSSSYALSLSAVSSSPLASPWPQLRPEFLADAVAVHAFVVVLAAVVAAAAAAVVVAVVVVSLLVAVKVAVLLLASPAAERGNETEAKNEVAGRHRSLPWLLTAFVVFLLSSTLALALALACSDVELKVGCLIATMVACFPGDAPPVAASSDSE